MRIQGLLLFAGTLASAQVTAITNARVVDGTGAPARVATVVFRAERIVSVGGEVPVDARRIDGSGYTLTPGFFDLHTHLPYSGVSGLRADWGKVLAAYLACGVTSVVDFGTYPETFEPMRRLLREGVVAGPRLHLAGRITTPLGHGAEGGRGDSFSLEVQTVAEAREAARRWLAYQPDAIKVFTDGWRYGFNPDMTSMEQAVLEAIVREARSRGVEVLTHTVTLEKAKEAARAGVDVIAHGIGNARVDAELIAIMRRNRTSYAPTLAVYENKSGPMSPQLRSLLEPLALEMLGSYLPPRGSKARQRRWENLMANVVALDAAGVNVTTGTDAGVTGTMHGYSTLREIQLLVEGGMSPLAAIAAATGNAARGINVDGERGTIEAGKLADLVLIKGVPDERISDIFNVDRVFLGGKELNRAKLLALIAASGMTPIPSRRATEWIDDMESPDGRSRLGTLRVNATDPGTDHSTMIFGQTLRAPANHALTIQARMAIKPGPFGSVWFPLSPGGFEPVDASSFSGIQFEARGEGSYRIQLQARSIRVFTSPAASFNAGPAWKIVRVPFASFRQAPPVRDLQVVEIELARGPGKQAWLELDNLRFY